MASTSRFSAANTWHQQGTSQRENCPSCDDTGPLSAFNVIYYVTFGVEDDDDDDDDRFLNRPADHRWPIDR